MADELTSMVDYLSVSRQNKNERKERDFLQASAFSIMHELAFPKQQVKF